MARDFVEAVEVLGRQVVLLLFGLHLAQLFVEELGLLQVLLLLADDLGLLEGDGHVFFLVLLDLLLHVFFPLALRLPFVLELDHLVVSLLEPGGLKLFPLLLRRVQSLVEGRLRCVLILDLPLQAFDLLLLDCLEAHCIIARFFDLFHELALLLCEVLNTTEHFRFVLLRLGELLLGETLRALRARLAPHSIAHSEAGQSDLGRGPLRIESATVLLTLH